MANGKLKKVKVWKDSTALTNLNHWIVKRDGRCMRCGKKENLQSSHYFGKQRSSVRFEPLNCDALCYPCHYGNLNGWEYHKSCCYKEYMRKKLGKKKYKELERLAHTSIPRKQAIINLMSWIK
mgnify:CR=1 FL=1